MKRALASVDANQVRRTISELLFNWSIHRNIAHHIVAVDAIHAARFHFAFRQPGSQFVGKENVDVGGQNELPAGPANADILPDHLVQRERLGMGESGVQFGGNFNESHLAEASVRGPAQNLVQPRPAFRRIPLHHD